MREVAVIGIGMNKWGELWDKSLRDLFVESALSAIKDSGIDNLDSMYVGCMSGGLFNQQEHIGAIMADYLGVAPIPAVRVESACASGGMSIRQAFIEVASGMSDIVLAGGVEKMNDISGDEATFALASAADAEYESFLGVTFPGLYAMMASAYMHKYNKITSEHLAHVAVKNHFHGSMNPNAQFPSKLTVEGVLNSVMVADPLHIMDCSPVTDGAAAVILSSMDVAKKLSKNNPIIQIIGSGAATDTIALHDRADLTYLPAVEKAAATAYKMSGKNPKDIDICEVHDCFTIAEIIATEALGFFEKGQGGLAAEKGETRFDGKKPINTAGGLKSKGHPVGATGVAQVHEIVSQLRGAAGQRQVKGAKIGMTQNMGGTGASSVSHILEVK
jgi:acetyl-CoA C-acetyltransferase